MMWSFSVLYWLHHWPVTNMPCSLCVSETLGMKKQSAFLKGEHPDPELQENTLHNHHLGHKREDTGSLGNAEYEMRTATEAPSRECGDAKVHHCGCRRWEGSHWALSIN